MQKRRLTADQVALLHHVELADAGWQERALDQLILATALPEQSVTLETVHNSISSIGGAAVSADRVDRSVRRLVGSRMLIEVSSGCYAPSQAARSEAGRPFSDGDKVCWEQAADHRL